MAEVAEESAFTPTFVDLKTIYSEDATNSRDEYREKSWGLIPKEALRSAVPAIHPPPVGGIGYLHWLVPEDWHTLDVRLLQQYRWRCGISASAPPLAIELRSPDELPPMKRGAELQRLDELALAVEGIWESVWQDVAVPDRPGLVLVRTDGVMPLSAAMGPARPALSALACEVTVDARKITRACRMARVEPPSASVISRLLRGLQKQGLLVLAESATRPLVYYSLPRVSYLRRQKYAVDIARPPISSLPFGMSDEFGLTETPEYQRWAWLHGRLQAEGLRSVQLEI